jgi:hypothetical protein
MLWRYFNVPVVTVIAIATLLSGLILFIIRSGNAMDATGRTRTMFLMVWFFLPYLLMFTLSFKVPVFLDRYTVFISPGLYLLLAVFTENLFPRKWYGFFVMILLVLGMVFSFRPFKDNDRDLREAVASVKQGRVENEAVILTPPWLEFGFTYHYDRSLFSDYRNFRYRLKEKRIFPAAALQDLDTNLLSSMSSVLFFEEWSSLTDPGQSIRGFLDRKFKFEGRETFRKEFEISRYKK